MHWLIPFSSLTPAQQDAVQMDTRSHKAIVGGPGAGKTLVLLHRLNLLFHRAGKNPDVVRLFVYTNTLKEFIRAGNDVLEVPDECILTFDKWCFDTYQTHVDQRLPKTDGKTDFDAIRAGVFHAIESGKLPTRKCQPEFTTLNSGSNNNNVIVNNLTSNIINPLMSS